MALVPATLDHVGILKWWFSERDAALRWGGPGLRFPFTHETFLEDICWDRMPAWSAEDESGALLGFGQYYLMENRCHLARLAVAPERREQGIGQRFIAALMRVGKEDLGVDASSLFVAMDNPGALGCYRQLGFEFAGWPDRVKRIGNVRFMTRSS